MSIARAMILPASVLAAAMLCGCANDRHKDIPADARLVTEGDKTLSYQFEQPGTVYIFDTDTDKMVYSGKVDRGQSIHVDPTRDRIMPDDKVVRDEHMRANDTRRVFFEPSTNRREVIVEEHRETR